MCCWHCLPGWARGVQPVITVKAEHLTVFIQHSDISNSREHTGRVYIHYILHIMSQCEKMMTSLLIRHRGERYGDTTVDRHNHFRSVITIKQATNCKQGVQPRLSAVRSNQYLISGILFQNMVEPPGSCYRCAGGRWGREGEGGGCCGGVTSDLI